MRLRLAGALLLSAAAYYVYLPLPSGVSEPWKLMLLDALFRSFMQAVRAERCAHGRPGEDRLMGGMAGSWQGQKMRENTRKLDYYEMTVGGSPFMR